MNKRQPEMAAFFMSIFFYGDYHQSVYSMIGLGESRFDFDQCDKIVITYLLRQ